MQQPDPRTIRLREQQAELDALTVIAYTNASDCLVAHGLASSIVVTNTKGETITISGSDLFDRKTWKTFLLKTQPTAEVYQLTGTVEPLAKQYAEWIVTQYTPRYRAITAEADLAWVKCVAVLVVKRHILEQKYDAYLTQQRTTFANPLLIAHMAVITGYHAMVKECARTANHILKDAARTQELLQQFAENSRHLAPDIQMSAEKLIALPSTSPSLQEETQQKESEQDE